jgi:hypothetical protein
VLERRTFISTVREEDLEKRKHVCGPSLKRVGRPLPGQKLLYCRLVEHHKPQVLAAESEGVYGVHNNARQILLALFATVGRKQTLLEVLSLEVPTEATSQIQNTHHQLLWAHPPPRVCFPRALWHQQSGLQPVLEILVEYGEQLVS